MLPEYCIGNVLTCIVCVKVIDPFCGFYNCDTCETAHHLLCTKTKVAAKNLDLAELKNKIFEWDQIGEASYHFLETGPYISYSSAPILGWKLEDGTLLPEKKMFEDCTFDEATRTFTGNINWPIRYNGNKLWEFTIEFDMEFTKISGGSVITYKTSGKTETLYFGRDLNYTYNSTFDIDKEAAELSSHSEEEHENQRCVMNHFM